MYPLGVIVTSSCTWNGCEPYLRQTKKRLSLCSKDVVYNNFPWPKNPTAKQTAEIETKAQAVLDARAQFPDSTLADLYDPLTMPPTLQKAHAALDKAVDRAYRNAAFNNEAARVAFLFDLYQQYTTPLLPKEKRGRGKKAVSG